GIRTGRATRQCSLGGLLSLEERPHLSRSWTGFFPGAPDRRPPGSPVLVRSLVFHDDLLGPSPAVTATRGTSASVSGATREAIRMPNVVEGPVAEQIGLPRHGSGEQRPAMGMMCQRGGANGPATANRLAGLGARTRRMLARVMERLEHAPARFCESSQEIREHGAAVEGNQPVRVGPRLAHSS